jgi:HD-GYP domain-containing protein (c-di-GMP phosphodiesterase class II)
VKTKLVSENTVSDTELNQIRLSLFSEIYQRSGKLAKLPELIGQITCMAQSALKASASSVLLLDEKKQELYFEVAEGMVGRKLRQIRINAGSGIAGWVVRNGRPLIVNDVSRDIRFNHNMDKTTGFNTRSMLALPLRVQNKLVGVIEIINKCDGSDFTATDLEVITPVASIAAITIENTRLHEEVTEGCKTTIKALAATIDAKHPYTRGHSQRVMEYTLIGAYALKLSEDEIEPIEYGSILHDTGKIGVPDNILNKPGPLDREEWKIMMQHPVIGANIIKDIPFLDEARDLVLHHHERFDGKGYPDNLLSQQIPMGARLIAVADTFDTMTTNRAYRDALTKDQAINELLKYSGTQFCPEAVRAFISGFNLRYQDSISQKVKLMRGARNS